MSVDAGELGIDGTLEILRRMLVERFQVALSPDEIRADEPLFAAGIGLSSMDGMELLLEIEHVFGITIDDVEAWFEDSPSLEFVSRYLVAQSQQRSSSTTDE